MKIVGNNALSFSQNIINFKAKELAFDALFKNLPVAFYWMDREGYFLGCNEVELKLHNLSSLDEFVGKHSDDISEPSAWVNSKKVMETNQTMTIEEIQIKPDGSEVYYLSIKSPIRDENNQVVGLLGVSIDITDRKKMENELKIASELKIAKEHAEAANQAKTQFLAVTSHELRLPLTGILGLTGFLKEEDLAPEEIKEIIANLDACSTHLLSLVNGILDFAKLEADKFQLNIVPFDLRKLTEEVVGMLTISAKNKNLDLILEYPPTVPSNIYADSRALRQILANLINNAIKFTEKGHVKVAVFCLEHLTQTARLKIVIEDTGKGISEDKLDYIFESFTQIEGAYCRNSSQSGTGLGLAIVKKLVNMMNGRIWVESELEKGSRFYFEIEFLLQNNATTDLPWASYAAHVKVLIIDDSPKGEVLCMNLGRINCNTVPSAEAINEIASSDQLGHPYHIVIIDQQLNDQNAFELLQSIQRRKKVSKFMPILMLARSSKSEQEAALAAGFFEVITKPIQPIALQTALTSAWERWVELEASSRQ